MHIFYFPDIKTNTFLLPEDESKHAVKVLRLTTGDQVQITDGKGGFYTAVIQEMQAKNCLLRIVSEQQQYGWRPYNIHVAVAPTKNIERLEWFIEKATEIGVEAISFLLCERSERKHLNLDRLEKVVVSAMKQSVKAYKPQLHDLISFKDFIQEQQPTQTYIAHLAESDQMPLHQVPLTDSVCVLIGPEGDFSPKEIQMAYAQGIKPITLGTSRLRTETAALVACHTLNLLHEMQRK